MLLIIGATNVIETITLTPRHDLLMTAAVREAEEMARIAMEELRALAHA